MLVVIGRALARTNSPSGTGSTADSTAHDLKGDALHALWGAEGSPG